MKIDAHQHFWRHDPAIHTWMDDKMQGLRQDFLPEQLWPLLQAEGIDGCVAVQADSSAQENDFLLGLAQQHPWILGVVGWVDLQSDQLPSQLDQFCQHSKAVGVRHIVQDEADDRFLDGAAFRHGVSSLPARGMTFDLLIYERQLPAAIDFVRALPDVPMVLDHIAKPRIAEGQLEPWAENLKQLARSPNLSCKLSGMVTEAHWQRWQAEDFTPYFECAIEAFGPERLMVGSDWPVCGLAADYSQVQSLVKPFLQPLSPTERSAIEGGNANRFYQFKGHP
ncbi:MAG: amidohydrolase family protein [Planctomycetota bacterium]|nr:amidohydrolase family protein [Planctomycetota bacterium]MDE0961261.1 amidohydrolase family protein [Planctomycetota bacterium]